MKQIKILSLLLAFVLSSVVTFAQRSDKQTPFVPNTKDFLVLKMDPHTHTVFSDGLVWPTVRINEAVNDATDVIAITDHIEYRPYLKDIEDKSHKRSYNLVKDYAPTKNIVLVRGTEITRSLPPGHFNALFIKDADAFDQFSQADPKREGANIKETLKEAYRQGGMVMWNHPSWPRGFSELFPIHEELIKEKLIDAIEVVNGAKYSPESLDWALKYNLAIIGSSDVHNAIDYQSNGHGYAYRSHTLVLAKERSSQGIREAMDARRTMAVQNNSIFGSDKNLQMLIPALITYSYSGDEKTGMLVLENHSGFSFEMELAPVDKFKTTKKVTLSPHSKSSIVVSASPKDSTIPAKCKLDIAIKNVWKTSKDNFVYSINF